MTPATRAAREAREALRDLLCWAEVVHGVTVRNGKECEPVCFETARAALSLLAAPGREDGAAAMRDACLSAVAQQRCERGTPWDSALVAALDAIHNLPLPAAPAREREADGPIRTPPMCETHPLHSEPCPICADSPVPPAGAPDPARGLPVFDPEAVERVVAKMDKPRPEWDRPRAGGVLPLDPYSPVRTDPAPRPEPGADLLAQVRAMLDVIDGITAYDDASGRRCYVDLDTQARRFSAGIDALDAAYRDVLAALQARERGDG